MQRWDALLDGEPVSDLAYHLRDERMITEMDDDELTPTEEAALQAALAEPRLEPMTTEQLAQLLGIDLGTSEPGATFEYFEEGSGTMKRTRRIDWNAIL